MNRVITKDGSHTYHNETYSETYHSLSGAREEAIEKYAKPCKIDKRENVSILDFCFGLGYNSAAAIDMFCGKKITIVALENDPLIIEEITKMDDYPFNCSEKIKTAAKNKEYCDGTVKIKLIIGDARETIKEFSDFDVVFFDPFSPKKCPELWTKEVFAAVYSKMKKGGILATYSCAGIVRRNMKEAGFSVEDGPRVGRNAPSTMAKKA